MALVYFIIRIFTKIQYTLTSYFQTLPHFINNIISDKINYKFICDYNFKYNTKAD